MEDEIVYKCEKCGMKSDDSYDFQERLIYDDDEESTDTVIYLCDECSNLLENLIYQWIKE